MSKLRPYNLPGFGVLRPHLFPHAQAIYEFLAGAGYVKRLEAVDQLGASVNGHRKYDTFWSEPHRLDTGAVGFSQYWSEPHGLDNGTVRLRPLAEHVGPHMVGLKGVAPENMVVSLALQTRALPKLFFFVLIIAALLGCEVSGRNPRLVVTTDAGVEVVTLEDLPSILDPGYQWEARIVREFRTEDSSGRPLVYNPTAVVPLRDGHIFVSDPLADDPLAVLDVDTHEVVARFGRRGRGPAELWGRRLLWEGVDESLLILNPENSHILRYSRDGEFLSAQRFVSDVMLMDLRIQPGTSRIFGEVFVPRVNHLRRIDLESGIHEEVIALPALSPDQTPGRIHRGRPLWTVLRSGIVTARSDVAAFRFFTGSGALVREILLPLSERRLTSMERQRRIAQYGDIARSLEVGPIAITNGLYAIDDSIFGTRQSNMWRAEEDPSIPEDQVVLRLMSVSGEYLGALPLPDGFQILAGGNGRLWGTAPDTDGVPIIREVLLVRPEALRTSGARLGT